MNDKPNLQKVMERIAKLHALAIDSGATEAEAASAAEKVQAMLAEYNLSISDVESNNKAEDNFVIDDGMMTDSLPWRRQMGAMVGKLYFC